MVIFAVLEAVVVLNLAKKRTDVHLFIQVNSGSCACTPGRIRTGDLEIRRLLLYPAELRRHNRKYSSPWITQNTT